ncbi:MAG: hypothetical protein SNJ53_01280 [Thermodesulfovibrionales bacterium]
MYVASKRLLSYLRFLYKTLVFSFLLLIIASCAKPHVTLPDYRDSNLQTLISELSEITGIEASLEVEFDKGDMVINGDMFLKADEKSMLLRIYYLGFPAGEIVEKDGEIRNTIKISKGRAQMIALGLKRSLFWWKNRFLTTTDDDDLYILLGDGIEVIIDKKSLLPIRQRLTLQNGESLDIYYAEPKQVEEAYRRGGVTDWYQSAVTLSYRNYKALSRINSLTLLRQ